ncbi:MAG TPA: hypothetical protein PKN32_06245 [Bacteroidales bacterium]|nr:hypothetical protein [Bacteroidales bacterium]
MKTKYCENCEKEFTAKRDDAKYCSSTCRHEAWTKSQEMLEKDKKFVSGLKGIVTDNKVVSKSKIIIKVPNDEFIQKKLEIENISIELQKFNHEKEKIAARIKFLQQPDNGFTPLAVGMAGAFLGYDSTKKNPSIEEDKRLRRTVTYGLVGFVGGAILDKVTKKSRENSTNEEIKQLQATLNVLNVSITELNRQLIALNLNRLLIPEYIEVETDVKDEVIPEPKYEYQDDKLEHKITRIPPSETFIETQNNVIEQKTDNPQTFKNSKPNSKIMSSTELSNLQYFALNFQNRWQDFLGLPSTNFHCAIHGMPGEGKSTFAIQFANYLAENFGTVVYVSGEEGFAKTMKDKLSYNNAYSPNLSIADLRTKDELLTEIEPNTFNFIFIDSLDNMRINAIDMKEIKLNYSNSALITISQSTKDGKMRGSQEIIHDADISIAVSNGVAETYKNRFLEKGKKFNIFTNRPKRAEDFMPDNTVDG